MPAYRAERDATGFAGHALLDAHERLDDPESLDLGLAADDWFLRRVPRTRALGGANLGYLAGDATAIHKANLLACSLLARPAATTGNAHWASAAEEGVGYSLAHQREDGV